MSLQNLSLFQAINSKMKFLDKRQSVISQNIANSDTPDYKALDLKQVDFSDMLKNVSTSRVNRVSMEQTQAGHISPNGAPANPRIEKNKNIYEIAPDSNAVIIEEQMIKANDIQMNYNLMTNLYRSNMDMLRTSLGRRG
jgi:flagellar basal-body rod protein FlgB